MSICPKGLVTAVKAYDLAVDILRVGFTGAPPFATKDPDLLTSCEFEHRVLVTTDRKSMPVHLVHHLAVGNHHWGVFFLDSGLSIGDMAYQLTMFWEASEAEEWIDRQEYLPY